MMANGVASGTVAGEPGRRRNSIAPLECTASNACSNEGHANERAAPSVGQMVAPVWRLVATSRSFALSRTILVVACPRFNPSTSWLIALSGSRGYPLNAPRTW